MDVTILMLAASALVILVIIFFLLKQRNDLAAPESAEAENERQGVNRRAGGPRRAVAARAANLRNRNVRGGNQNQASDGEEPQVDDDDDIEADAEELFDSKLGAKKRAKMEAKAEKKAMREAEQRDREEKKKREAKKELERQKEIAEKEAEEEQVREAERKAQEEKERKEHEEYLKLKEAFSVESEGFDETVEEDEQNSLRAFVQYIQDNKVVILEDLALRFKYKIKDAIDKIGKLQEDGILTGVFDDRGKFIFLSKKELEAVAKFIRQRGRVSIAELAASSSDLINFAPVNTASA
ncbi:Hypothetical predicted protein [Cloeon dipterum]|uniref:DDRGK domain-containing protein 1 n=1 Tax=Cloeon dipterum TaxID=197152 RepID=A0A8S1C298_9INSE|nr:Hypothetical predicted protein [Cloeon dipterum]